MHYGQKLLSNQNCDYFFVKLNYYLLYFKIFFVSSVLLALEKKIWEIQFHERIFFAYTINVSGTMYSDLNILHIILYTKPN